MDRSTHDATDRTEAMGYVQRNVTLAAAWSGLLGEEGVRWQCDIPASERCAAVPECLWHRLNDGDRRLVVDMVDLVDSAFPADG